MAPSGRLSADHVTKQYRVGEPRSVFSWRAIPSLLRRPDSGRSILAVDDVSFRIEPGESVGLIGPNGTGKSTLLRVLTGITAPTRGVAKASGRIAAVLDLGSGFYDELTAYDNTLLNGQLLGMSRREVLAKLDNIFSFAELTDFVHAPMRQFSFGMRLRLAFSIAMALRPEILLLDEVLGVGDLRFQRRSAACIQEMLASGVTLVLVSHHLTDLARVCRRGLLLSRGKLVFDGEMSDCISEYLAANTGSRSSTPPAFETVPTDPAGAAANESQNAAVESAVTLLAVDVVGETGLEQSEFRCGESITLRVRLKTSTPIDRPIITFSIFRDDGLLMAQPGTDTLGMHTGTLSGVCEIGFSWECPFHYGGFRVSAAIADSTGRKLLAQAHSAAGFEVRPRSGFSHGAVRIDGHWSIDQQAE